MKRSLVRIAFFGAFGLAITVAHCWFLALVSDPIAAPRFNSRGGAGMAGYFSEADRIMWIFHAERTPAVLQITAGNRGPNPENSFGEVKAQWYVDAMDIPQWSVMRRGDRRGIHDAFYYEQAFGWPMLAMVQSERSIFHPGLRTIQVGGVEVPDWVRKFLPGRSVPYRVLWIGALVNAGMYGWLCFAVIGFPGLVIRARRRSKGLCEACGYDLRGAIHARCPECGGAIPGRSGEQ